MRQEKRNWKVWCGRCCAATVLGVPAVVIPRPAEAHGIYIYAWTEGAQVCTESYFSRTDKVQGGRVSMSTAGNAVPVEALTDEDGRACFILPETDGPLRFTVDAGPGHRATCTVGEAEVRAARTIGQRRDVGKTAQDKTVHDIRGESKTTVTVRSDSGTGCDEAALRRIIREELAAYSDLQHRKAERAAQFKEPGWREIGAGLGWIMGLASLMHWVLRRRRKGASHH